jgi:hypothetical protein
MNSSPFVPSVSSSAGRLCHRQAQVLQQRSSNDCCIGDILSPFFSALDAAATTKWDTYFSNDA